jgi:hypothetical protein
MAVRRRAVRARFSISVDASKREGSACLYPDPFSAAVGHRMVLTLFYFRRQTEGYEGWLPGGYIHDSH